MESMSQIIAAMMQMTPGVTQMGAAPGGGGGGVRVPAMGGGGRGGGMGADRPRTPAQVTPLDVPDMGGQMQESGAPVQSGVYEGNTNPATGGGMADNEGTFPDPDQLLKTYIDAQLEVRKLKAGQTWDDRKALPRAMENEAWAKKNLQDYQTVKTNRDNQANADQIYITGTPIVGEPHARNFATYVKIIQMIQKR